MTQHPMAQTNTANGETVRLHLPAKLRYLNVVTASLRAILERLDGETVAEDVIYNVQLAVHEICNNIVEHAYGHEDGELRLVITIQRVEQAGQMPEQMGQAAQQRREEFRRQLIVDLYDSGQSFAAEETEPSPPDEPRVKGYGLFLAHQLLDEVTYTVLPNNHHERNHWQLTKHL